MDKIIENSMNFDGMTTKPGLSLLASFVQHAQNFNDSSGLVEFGTYRGRVSSMLGQLKREKDELHLVDISDYLNHEMMKSLGLNYSFHKTSSENLSPNQMCDKFYFSHHDASHYFSNVTHELNIMKTLMEKNGVIALDDFTDPYNQVRAAYYHNRYANKYPFELLIIGFGKGILVHQDMFNTYEAFVINELQEKMRACGVNTTLFRTDYSNHSRAFSIASKKNASDPDLYGLNIWGNKFYKVSK